VWTARILGLFSGVVALALLFCVARYHVPEDFSEKTRQWFALLPVALLAANGTFAMWAVGGLETVFFTLLLILAAFIYLRFADRMAAFLCGLILALLVMTRPDGVVFLGVTLVHAACVPVVFPDENTRSRPAANALWIGLAFFVLYTPYFAWRYFYYGALLPNTFYAKVGLHGTSALSSLAVRGIKYSWLFLADYGLVPVIVGIFALNALIWRPRGTVSIHRKAIVESSYLLLQIVACLAFVVYVGGDQLVMHRFFVPILPALYLLTMRALCEVFPREAEGASFRITANRRFLVFALCAGGVVLTALPSFVGREHHRVFVVEKPADDDRKIVGKWLKDNVGGDATIALIPAGIIPFYSGLETIDLVGLNDRRIAHAEVSGFGSGEPGHEKYDSTYVLERRPDIMLLGACRIMPRKLSAQGLLNYAWLYGKLVPGNREMLRLEEFQRNYIPCAAAVGSGYIHFFKHKGFEMPPAEPLRTGTVAAELNPTAV
jgi:hypothetical protein